MASTQPTRGGPFYLENLAAGDYRVTQLTASQGYAMDNVPNVRTVRTVRLQHTNADQSVFLVEYSNSPLGTLLVNLRDSVTKEPISGAVFNVRLSGGADLGNFVWENVPQMGQIQIMKRSGDENEVNGLPSGAPLEGAVFEVYNQRTGNLVDRFVSGSDGRAVSSPLPLGRYIVKEVQAPQWYKLYEMPSDMHELSPAAAIYTSPNGKPKTLWWHFSDRVGQNSADSVGILGEFATGSTVYSALPDGGINDDGDVVVKIPGFPKPGLRIVMPLKASKR